MSMVLTPVHARAVVQASETRLSSLEKEPRVIHENLLKSMVVLGDKARFVIGWTGFATANFLQPGDTRDWLFKTLYEMNAPWLTAEQIMDRLSTQATRHFAAFSLNADKRTHFVLGGWEISASAQLSPFVGVVSNSVTGRNDTRSESNMRHHIPTYEESVRARPNFQGWIERFKNVSDENYVVNAMGDFKRKNLDSGFRGLRGLLKKEASAERIAVACRQIILEAANHSNTVGKNVVTVEMHSDGRYRCCYYPEHGSNILLVPDVLSTQGCHTRATITTVEGKVRFNGKIAKATREF